MSSLFKLPHEGLTLEAAYAPFRLTALNPLVTGPLLLALLKQPGLLSQLRSSLSPTLQTLVDRFSPGTNGLKILFALGALRVLNNWYSRKSINNWVTDVYDWKKEIILITGGSSGIGDLMAKDFAGRGIKVIICDLNEPKSLPPNVHFYKLDVSKSEVIKEVGQKIHAEHGDPTILINNAGIGTAQNILEEPEEKIRATINVNLMAHFLMVKQFVPAMVKKNHGHVVAIASMATFATVAGNGDYSATKAGVLSFMEALTVELSDTYKAPKVRTTIVHPIWIRTPLIQDLPDSPNFKDFLLEPETVSETIVNQILSGEGKQIFLPARYALVPLLRAMPQWLGHNVRRGMAATLRVPDGYVVKGRN